MKTLRLFLDVASSRSISRAAVAHGITQSAVSQRISQLEAKLGVALLDRSVRPLALTAAGEVFAEEVADIVERYRKLTSRIGEMVEVPEGDVRVSAIYSAGIDLLKDLREQFVEANPGVAIHLSYKRPEEVDRSVREGSCDFGIVSYPRRWQGMGVRRLRDERMSVVCPPNHPLLARETVKASELASWPMIGLEADLPVSRHIRRYLKAEGVEPEYAYEPDNIDTMKSMLEIGDQIAILPRRTVAREVAAGALGVVDLLPELNRPMGIIQRRKPRLKLPARAFLEFLVKHADPDAVLEEQSAPVSMAS